YLLPVGLTVGKTHSVAHLISADDDHVSLRVSGKDGRKAAHEGPESTVGLEIARDVRDDLVPNPQLPIVIRQTQVAEGSGFHDARVDSIVDDAKHRLVPLGVERSL